MSGQGHPECINSSNPYHECTDFCLRKIAEGKGRSNTETAPAKGDSSHATLSDLPQEFGRQQQKRKKPFDRDPVVAAEEEHETDDVPRAPVNVFARPINDEVDDEEDSRDRGGRGVLSPEGRREEQGRGTAEKPRLLERGTEVVETADGEPNREFGSDGFEGEVDRTVEKGGLAEGTEGAGVQADDAPSYENMSGRERRLFELRLKLNQARKANQTAVVAERKKEKAAQEAEEAPQHERRGMSKAKWFEEKKKRMGKVLEANGLDMSRAHMLDTQEAAEEKYKKWEKKEAAFGWDVFNQKSLYKAYEKRADNISVDMESYERQKEHDPNFFAEGPCLEYGKTPDIPEENVERMATELQERGKKRKDFSRRRRYHEDKDIDSINERNEHFNRKIARAFGKYTVEIKNNLERGTALPD